MKKMTQNLIAAKHKQDYTEGVKEGLVMRLDTFMSYSYSEHIRIALDILEKTQENVNYITDIVLKIKKACKGETPFSTHSICDDAEDWLSVLKGASTEMLVLFAF